MLADRPLPRRLFRGAVSLLVLVALGWQFVSSLGREATAEVEAFRPVNFFSYFTIHSNLAAAVLFVLLEVARPGSGFARVLHAIRPAVTLYMGMTGVIYLLLLAPESADVGLSQNWVDLTVHMIAPLAIVADWFLAPSPRTPRYLDVPWWMIYPAVFVTYSLLRGARADWYPYPFLDPRDDGYLQVVTNVAVLTAGVLLLAGGCVALTRMTNEVRGPRPAPLPPAH